MAMSESTREMKCTKSAADLTCLELQCTIHVKSAALLIQFISCRECFHLHMALNS